MYIYFVCITWYVYLLHCSNWNVIGHLSSQEQHMKHRPARSGFCNTEPVYNSRHCPMSVQYHLQIAQPTALEVSRPVRPALPVESPLFIVRDGRQIFTDDIALHSWGLAVYNVTAPELNLTGSPCWTGPSRGTADRGQGRSSARQECPLSSVQIVHSSRPFVPSLAPSRTIPLSLRLGETGTSTNLNNRLQLAGWHNSWLLYYYIFNLRLTILNSSSVQKWLRASYPRGHLQTSM